MVLPIPSAAPPGHFSCSLKRRTAGESLHATSETTAQAHQLCSTRPEGGNARSSRGMPFAQLHAIAMPFRHPIAPLLGQACLHGCQVIIQPVRTPLSCVTALLCDLFQPVGHLRARAPPHHSQKRLDHAKARRQVGGGCLQVRQLRCFAWAALLCWPQQGSAHITGRWPPPPREGRLFPAHRRAPAWASWRNSLMKRVTVRREPVEPWLRMSHYRRRLVWQPARQRCRRVASSAASTRSCRRRCCTRGPGGCSWRRYAYTVWRLMPS